MSILGFTKKISGRNEKPSKPAKAGKKKAAALEPNKVLLAGTIGLTPVVTEKSMLVQALSNTVVFRVDKSVTKKMVAQAVEKKYNVVPKDVRLAVQKPKIRRRGRTVGKTKVWKKAYVTLPEGKSIDVSALS